MILKYKTWFENEYVTIKYKAGTGGILYLVEKGAWFIFGFRVSSIFIINRTPYRELIRERFKEMDIPRLNPEITKIINVVCVEDEIEIKRIMKKDIKKLKIKKIDKK